MRRILLLSAALAACASGAGASEQVRLWHSLDPATAFQLARMATEYNAAQGEFRVQLEPLPKPGTSGLHRIGLPLDTARPVLYYNRDAFRRAKLDPGLAPKTWYEMPAFLGALADSGQSCAYTTAWPAWVMMENSGGAFSRQMMVRWTSMLATWEKSGFFSYSGRSNEAEARFAAGECAVLTSSSASRTELARRARFDVGIAPLPRYDDAEGAAHSLPAAGPAVWAQRQSVGVTSFLAFVAGRAARARRDRDIIEEQLEAVWRGEKTAPDALDAYSSKLK
jgi:ABC-type glycerol-3-phosphate transport system substrate-binding protein